MEQFTAVAPCPSCGDLGLHWMDHPRKRPDPNTETPAQRGLRIINESMNALSIIDGGARRELYEPDDATIARICRNCNHRWAQQ